MLAVARLSFVSTAKNNSSMGWEELQYGTISWAEQFVAVMCNRRLLHIISNESQPDYVKIWLHTTGFFCKWRPILGIQDGSETMWASFSQPDPLLECLSAACFLVLIRGSQVTFTLSRFNWGLACMAICLVLPETRGSNGFGNTCCTQESEGNLEHYEWHQYIADILLET